MSVSDPAVEAGHIVFERRGALALVRLSRPEALNAVTHDMIRSLARRLDEWAADDGVEAVAVTAEGKAFSAGGDIRALYERIVAGDPPDDFFADEYALNIAIKRFPKPYVALIDGLAMGGGVGVSYHGSHVVVGEGARFAMPECGIGFFPDVGGSHMLSRLDGGVGLYLGLTGERIGPDAQVALGLAHTLVPSRLFGDVLDDLADGRPADDAVAAREAEPGAGAAALLELSAPLAGCDADGAHALLEDGTGRDASGRSADPIRERVAGKCPVSLAVAVRQIAAGRDLDFEAAMGMEARIVHAMLRRPDFAEGVRAAVIDKDRAPRWRPAQLGDVDKGIVDTHFAPVSNGPLAALSERGP